MVCAGEGEIDSHFTEDMQIKWGGEGGGKKKRQRMADVGDFVLMFYFVV